jgi:hypothetical protein
VSTFCAAVRPPSVRRFRIEFVVNREASVWIGACERHRMHDTDPSLELPERMETHRQQKESAYLALLGVRLGVRDLARHEVPPTSAQLPARSRR